MMTNNGAGWWRFGVIVFLCGAGWTVAQTMAISEEKAIPLDVPEVEVASAFAPPAESLPQLSPEERLAELKTADLEAMKAAQQECIRAAQIYSERIPMLRRQAMEAMEEARKNAPEIQALQQQIKDLEAQKAEYLKNLPEIKAMDNAIEQAQQAMLAELQLRTAIEGLIGRHPDGLATPASTLEEFRLAE